jgi:antitoxin PrlF
MLGSSAIPSPLFAELLRRTADCGALDLYFPYSIVRLVKIVRKTDVATSATLTSKGQMTLPKPVRERFGLRSGDRLEVAIDDQRILLIPKTLHLADVCSLLPAPQKPVSLEEMEDAVARGATDG